MAESQVPYSYGAETISSLRASLSDPRFQTYLTKANGDQQYAFALYLYNARLAKAFLFPLNVAEVTLRNAVDETLVKGFGPDWHVDSTLRTRILNDKSLDALGRAISKAGSNDRGKVIAELAFDFWSNLFRPEYHELWRTKANIAFPSLDHGQGRKEIQKLVKEINRLRNRVAHHEHILNINPPDTQSKINQLIGLRCPVTVDWMRHHSTVNIVMRSKPNKAGSAPVTLEAKSDPRFLTAKPDAKLIELCREEARACSAIVCVEGNRPAGAFTFTQLFSFIAEKAVGQDGIVVSVA